MYLLRENLCLLPVVSWSTLCTLFKKMLKIWCGKAPCYGQFVGDHQWWKRRLVVFTMSVGFGGQLIGYVTTGRALICFLPPAHRCSTHLLLTADPSYSFLNVCPSSDTLYIESGSVEVQVGEWWRKIWRQNSWIEKLFAAADKASMLLHFDK